jgi:hypothetical protein
MVILEKYFKVKIVSCLYPEYWYSHLVGKEINVIVHNKTDYKECGNIGLYQKNNKQHLHCGYIAKADCEVG